MKTTLFIFASFLMTSFVAQAAPSPMTSSSSLVSGKRGLLRSAFGFEIHAEKTDWVQVQPPNKIKNLVAWYKAPEADESEQAGLTVRADKFDKNVEPAKYMRHWRADYSRFGFNILRMQQIKPDGNSGYLVELLHQSTQKQIRQVIYFKDTVVVTMACRDSLKSFEKTVRDCNQIFRNFSWL